ncbi:MAG: hypothetical protein ABIH46_13925 [Chloroflexota bacterium]
MVLKFIIWKLESFVGAEAADTASCPPLYIAPKGTVDWALAMEVIVQKPSPQTNANVHVATINLFTGCSPPAVIARTGFFMPNYSTPVKGLQCTFLQITALKDEGNPKEKLE